MAHEIEHQAQYQNSNNPGQVLEQLIREAQTNEAAYSTSGTLENQAQVVEDRANECAH